MSTNKNNSILNTKNASIKIPSYLKKEYDSVNKILNSIDIEVDKIGQNVKNWDINRKQCIKGNAGKKQLTILQKQGQDVYSQLQEKSHITKKLANEMSDQLWKIVEPHVLTSYDRIQSIKRTLTQKLKTLNDRLLTPEQRTFKDQIHAARKQSQSKNNMNHEISRRIKNKMNGLEKR